MTISDATMPFVLFGTLSVAGVLSGVVAVLARRMMLIITSSWCGAFLFGLSVDTLLAPTPTALVPALLMMFSSGTLPPHPAFDWHTYLILVGMGILWLFGSLFQVKVSAKDYHHETADRNSTKDEYTPLLIQSYT